MAEFCFPTAIISDAFSDAESQSRKRISTTVVVYSSAYVVPRRDSTHLFLFFFVIFTNPTLL